MKLLVLTPFCLLIHVILAAPKDAKVSGQKNAKVEKKSPKSLLPRDSLLCSAVTAHFEGVFHNDWQPYDFSPVQFQVQLAINKISKEMKTSILNWNETLAHKEHVWLGFETNWCKLGLTCTYSIKKPASLYVTFNPKIDTGYDNQFHFLYLKKFKNQFRLDKTIGQCTKVQAKYSCNKDPPNHSCREEVEKSRYKSCLCCGEYLPDPALDCPKNPWL